MNNTDMENIVWITPRCFVETDIYAIRLLKEKFSIHWYIVEEKVCEEYKDLMDEMVKSPNLTIEKLMLPARNRNIKCLRFYSNLLQRVNELRPDLVYTPIFGMPYFMPLFALKLDRSKSVVAVHNVTTPKGSKAPSYISKLYTWFVTHAFQNYHTLSPSQCNLLKQIRPKSNVFCVPFVLKDYGTSMLAKPSIPTFLFFGQILEYKRVDVLILAAQKVYEETGRKFRVKIAGSSPYWEKYSRLIKYPELFDLTIRRIDNNEIPDLFATSHYFVMPYQDIAQSGAMMVAVNYDLPIIASDVPAFVEYIKDGVNGYIMNPASVDDLYNIIKSILLDEYMNYDKMSNNMCKLKREFFADDAICNSYADNFVAIIKK